MLVGDFIRHTAGCLDNSHLPVRQQECRLQATVTEAQLEQHYPIVLFMLSRAVTA